MALSAAERALLRALWKKLGSNVGVYATEALERTLEAFPRTKIYFSHMDLSPGSAQVRAHGRKVADALTLAADHLDDLPGALSALSDLHVRTLRVDPHHFGIPKYQDPLLAHPPHTVGAGAHSWRQAGMAVDNAVKNMDNLDGTLSTLRHTLPYMLRVDPVNFRLLPNCLLVTLAGYLSRDFTAESQLTWDKFLRHVFIIPTEKYP
uniref:Globin domain-containing protein n=1 Tax=Oryctolagus cuniculus TaxID=9986 RepID=G1SHJ4_RABIT